MIEEKNYSMHLRRGDVVELRRNMLPAEFSRIGATRFAVVVSCRKSQKCDAITVLPIITEFYKEGTETKLKLRMKDWYHFYCDFSDKVSFVVTDTIRTINKCRIVRIAGYCEMTTIKESLRKVFNVEQITERSWNRSWVQKNDIIFYNWGELDGKEVCESEGIKFRPSLVIAVNPDSNTAIIVPITTLHNKRVAGMIEMNEDDININYGRPNFELRPNTVICFDKYRTVYINYYDLRNFYKLGEVHPNLYEKINADLKAALGLNPTITKYVSEDTILLKESKKQSISNTKRQTKKEMVILRINELRTFSDNDLYEIASRPYVYVILKELLEAGKIQKVKKGVYKISPAENVGRVVEVRFTDNRTTQKNFTNPERLTTNSKN